MSRTKYLSLLFVLGGCAALEPFGSRKDRPAAIDTLFADVDGGGICGNVVRDKARSRAVATERAVPRILHGDKSELKYVVAITSDGTMGTKRCGGSLIDKQWVLTAAHCQVQPGDKLVIGVTDLRTIPASAIYPVAEVLTHAEYNAVTHDSDIALVKLSKTVTGIDPVKLFDGAVDLAASGAMVTVAGWGATSEGGPQSPILLEVDVPAVSNAVCTAAYSSDAGPPVVITDNMLCAGSVAKDSCQGDSGGPIVVANSGPDSQVGIVSFGTGCGRDGLYGVYTRVSKFKAWIESCAKN